MEKRITFATHSLKELDTAVNNWLAEHPNIKIVRTNDYAATYNSGTETGHVCVIWYKESK